MNKLSLLLLILIILILALPINENSFDEDVVKLEIDHFARVIFDFNNTDCNEEYWCNEFVSEAVETNFAAIEHIIFKIIGCKDSYEITSINQNSSYCEYGLKNGGLLFIARNGYIEYLSPNLDTFIALRDSLKSSDFEFTQNAWTITNSIEYIEQSLNNLGLDIIEVADARDITLANTKKVIGVYLKIHIGINEIMFYPHDFITAREEIFYPGIYIEFFISSKGIEYMKTNSAGTLLGMTAGDRVKCISIFEATNLVKEYYDQQFLFENTHYKKPELVLIPSYSTNNEVSKFIPAWSFYSPINDRTLLIDAEKGYVIN